MAFPGDGNSGLVKSAVVVRRVDDLLEACPARPVHISEICQTLNLSRRTLHRAFAETLGIGPAAYLRRRRLNAVRTGLQRGEVSSITRIAMDFGFDDVGRFAGYYRQLFGELPSETVRRFADDKSVPAGPAAGSRAKAVCVA